MMYGIRAHGCWKMNLVVERDVTEQLAHGLVVINSPDCFAQHQGNVHSLDLVASHLLNLMGDCIGDNYLKIDMFPM